MSDERFTPDQPTPIERRFAELGERGTPRGADTVLAAAMAAASRSTHRKDSAMSDELPPIADELEIVEMQPRAPRASRRSRAIAGLGIAALLGVGGYAAIAAQSGGGADSPQAAVEQLARAINDEDALAAVDVLAPSEVRSLKQSVKKASSKAEQIELVQDQADPFRGFEVDVVDLETEVETLAPGFAKVTITSGVIRGEIDPDGLAARFADVEPGEPGEIDLTNLRREDHDDYAAVETATTMVASASSGEPTPLPEVTLPEAIEPEPLPTFVIAIEDGDGWYLSPAYTAFEYARDEWERDHGETVTVDLGSADAAQLGAADPEAAVREAMSALEASDWERLIELAPPGEIPAWEYRNLVLGAIDPETQSNIAVDRLDVRVEIDGDRATAFVEGNGTTENGTWQLGGECDAGWFGYSADGYDDVWCFAGRGSALVPVALFFAPTIGVDSGPFQVNLVRESGRWFVSPVGSSLGIIDGFVEQFDADALAALTGDYHLIEPSGAIEFGVPVSVPRGGPIVLTLDVQGGTEIISQARGDLSFMLLNPDGQVFASDYSGLDGAFAVPESGTYRLLVWAYSSDATVMLVEGSVAAIEPEGRIELGNEVRVGAGGPYVYTFDGQAGQELVWRDESLDARVVDVNGQEVEGEFGIDVRVVTLPSDGRYLIVLYGWEDNVAFTMWNRADAPPGVVSDFGDGGSGGSYEECSSDGTVTTCVSYDEDGNPISTSTYSEGEGGGPASTVAIPAE